MARLAFGVSCLLGVLVLSRAASDQEYKGTGYKSTEYESTDYQGTGYKNTGYKSTAHKSTGYKSTEYDGTATNEIESQVYVYPAGFKGGRYYYGGVYKGSCQADGLYYRDEDSFVVCSNGNAYMQPCAPGTRSSGQHRYSPGYYYGYSDFCDINLVDQGYGPAHYAPYGVPTYQSSGHGGQDTPYNTEKATNYDVIDSSNAPYGYVGIQNGYGSEKNAYAGSYAKGQPLSFPAVDVYSKKETAYEPSGKF